MWKMILTFTVGGVTGMVVQKKLEEENWNPFTPEDETSEKVSVKKQPPRQRWGSG